MGDFTPVLDIDQDLPNVNTSKLGGDIYSQDQNPDYLLLKQLQEEEDQNMLKDYKIIIIINHVNLNLNLNPSSTTKSGLH